MAVMLLSPRYVRSSLKKPPAAMTRQFNVVVERASRLACEQFKARHSLSLADALIAAAAQQVGATLLHKDPEFRAIADLSQEWLG